MQSKAGQPFSTADAAAFAAIQEINPTSIANKWEYAGRIYQKKNGIFYFTKAQTEKSSDTSNPGPKMAGAKNIGTYHTHAGAFADTDEIFSPQDKLKATMAKELSYIETPYQRILKFTPVDLLPQDQQSTNPTGLAEVLLNIWVLPEITIVGDPKAKD
jgi:hypothetical protein